MPPQRFRRKRRHDRSRTSSQSSVEIQVTQTEITQTTESVVPSQQYSVQPALVKPVKEFLTLLKTVDAKGSWYAGDELFSIKQLCLYLTEYIQKKELFDSINPLVVYCKDDPLGSVFGVEKFSRHEALKYILSHCEQVVSRQKQENMSVENSLVPSTQPNLPNLEINTDILNPLIPKQPETFVVPQGQSMKSENRSASNTSPSPGLQLPCQMQDGRLVRKRQKNGPDTSETNHKSPQAGTSSQRYSPDNSSHRVRQSSFSIVYNSDDGRGGSSPWALTFELMDSGDESVLSIQSKETALVQDSTDDLWFLTDENSEDDTQGFSVEMNERGISVEFGGPSDPPFAEEYEVEENSGPETGPEYDTDGSESPLEEIYVVYDESDEDFWADSESSDYETDNNSTDEELGDADKWKCLTCQLLNYPVRRYCDKCWTVRPNWLTEHMSRSQKIKNNGKSYNYFGLTEEQIHNQVTTANKFDSDNELCNDKIEVKKSDMEVENNIGIMKRTESMDTLPASDIDVSNLESANKRKKKKVPTATLR